jgi:hypothetical protein
MTTQMNSPFASKFVLAIALVGMIVVAGSVGAGNGEHRIDPSTLLTSAQIADLPVLTVEQPF